MQFQGVCTFHDCLHKIEQNSKTKSAPMPIAISRFWDTGSTIVFDTRTAAVAVMAVSTGLQHQTREENCPEITIFASQIPVNVMVWSLTSGQGKTKESCWG